MKSSEEIMEILEAYDLTGGLRAAAQLAGCDHKTVAHYVALRDAGASLDQRVRRPMAIDPFLDKVEEWVDRSNGHIRADVVHDKLAAMGFTGSDRSTRRAVSRAKRAWRAGNRRVFRPWIPEPGLWLQFDWGEGPRIAGRRTLVFCAWLAWSRFRVVLPVWDRTLPSLLACLDTTLRTIGGAPTYALTDNEKTVTVEHIARVPVRHPDIVAAGRHYGMTIRTCVPADPQSKGGTEASVRIAKADLVPTEANLLEQYATFDDLQKACAAFCEQVNARVHRATGRPPVDMLADERDRLHMLPEQPVTVAFGQTRRVCWDSTISVGGVRYSVPHQHVDERVWARWSGDELVVTVVDADGPREIARHQRGQRGRPQIRDEHYPPDHPSRRAVPGTRTPRAGNPAEAAFLAIGDGAASWLIEAAAAGTGRVRFKMAEAVALAKLHGIAAVDQALGTAALAGRFADTDLAAILAHQQAGPACAPVRVTERHSLQPGTASWAHFGAPTPACER
ncbi:MAG: IS21 family transposase [Sporichthyaceae bacterium]|nr:IS21 family transposase [Sporichthyaceae bacterium]